MKRELQCSMCHRRGNRNFKRDQITGTTVCMATKACMDRYRENQMLNDWSHP